MMKMCARTMCSRTKRIVRWFVPAAIAAAFIASSALAQAATAQRQKGAPAPAQEPDLAYGAYQRGLI